MKAGEISATHIFSPFQEDSVEFLSLATDQSYSRPLAIILVLPVEKRKGSHTFGSGIEEIKALVDSQRCREDLLFVQPSFSRVPWYGNHPTHRKVRQSDFVFSLIKVLKKQFRAVHPEIYLLGFSKSGWGALSLLLEKPKLIAGIFIWDAPLHTSLNYKWKMSQVFESEAYFQKKYALAPRIQRAKHRLANKPIIIGGYDLFEAKAAPVVKQLEALNLVSVHDTTLTYSHRWDRRWILPLLRHASFCQ